MAHAHGPSGKAGVPQARDTRGFPLLPGSSLRAHRQSTQKRVPTEHVTGMHEKKPRVAPGPEDTPLVPLPAPRPLCPPGPQQCHSSRLFPSKKLGRGCLPS